jgi:hypothetical protein
MMLVEPAFGCAAPAVPELLAQVLAKLYAAFPPGTELPQEVRSLAPVSWCSFLSQQSLLPTLSLCSLPTCPNLVRGRHTVAQDAGVIEQAVCYTTLPPPLRSKRCTVQCVQWVLLQRHRHSWLVQWLAVTAT